MITGEKILVTGVTGLVGLPLARFLAQQNEVWGIARFAEPADRKIETREFARGGRSTDPASRENIEAVGIKTCAIDLGSGDFSTLPDDFTYVVHLAWMRADLAHLEQALRTNVEGAGLLLQHCRKAKAALVMSGMGIYTGHDDPWHAYTETDPIGRGATAYAPTSPASKLGLEAVARFCARAFNLPVTITRLNTLMAGAGSFPGHHIQAVLNGRTMMAPSDPNPHSPIHIDDMKIQIEALLGAAGTTALITNWCGDETVTAQDWVKHAAAWSGKPGHIDVVKSSGTPAGTRADPTRRRSITGPCKTVFKDEYRKLYDDIVAGRAA